MIRTSILLLAVLVHTTGCSSLEHPLTTAGFAGGGALLANQLSKGNPAATVAGAAGGALLAEGWTAWRTQKERDAYQQGFQKGRSDGVKQLYWNLQDAQRPASPNTPTVTTAASPTR